jgi:hypothetical protein
MIYTNGSWSREMIGQTTSSFCMMALRMPTAPFTLAMP